VLGLCEKYSLSFLDMQSVVLDSAHIRGRSNEGLTALDDGRQVFGNVAINNQIYRHTHTV
jgi:hypothetical protein